MMAHALEGRGVLDKSSGIAGGKLGYSDVDRSKIALKGIEGKRLTYRPTRQG